MTLLERSENVEHQKNTLNNLIRETMAGVLKLTRNVVWKNKSEKSFWIV